MAVNPATYWSLSCDGTEGEPCDTHYWDAVNECVVLAHDLAQLHEWAAVEGWVRYGAKDLCPNTVVRVAAGPHTFTPGPDGIFCLLCKDWAANDRHHTVNIDEANLLARHS